MDNKLMDNLKSESRWIRLFFMVLFCFIGLIAGGAIMAVAGVQVIHGFVAAETNGRLLIFSAGLNRYFYQIAQFITFNSEVKPFPFSDWPGAEGQGNRFVGESGEQPGEEHQDEEQHGKRPL